MEEASKADQEQDEGELQPDVATGELIYTNRCAECHGEDAAGTDQASSLVGLTLSEDDFEDLIRTAVSWARTAFSARPKSARTDSAPYSPT